MSDDHLNARLRRHFESLAPTEETMERLRDTAQPERAPRTAFDSVHADRVRSHMRSVRSEQIGARTARFRRIAALLVWTVSLGTLGYLGYAYGPSLLVRDGMTGQWRTNADIIAIWMDDPSQTDSSSMAQKIEQLDAQFSDDDVLFVRYDTTGQSANGFSEEAARSLGVLDAWRSHNASAGEIVLIDRRTGKPIETLTRDQTIDGMTGAVRRVTRSAPGK